MAPSRISASIAWARFAGEAGDVCFGRPWLWLCWFALAFGVMNVYGPPLGEPASQGSPAANGQLPPTSALLQTFLRLQRGGDDIERYFAYANAALGRPYLAKHIRLTDEGRSVASTAAGGVATPSRPLRPWRDFSVEYPPGMLVPIVAPALLTANFETYFLLFCLEMEAALTLAVALAAAAAEALTPGAGRRALGLSLLLTAALGCVVVRRYDACVALAIAAVIYGVATRRPIVAAVALALGAALKGVPLLMAPILLLWFVSRRDWRGLALAAASGAICLGAVAVVYVVAAGPHALDFFSYHGDRPLQLETPYAGALMLLAPRFPDLAPVVYSYGSDNLASVAEPWLRAVAGGLEVAALVTVYLAAHLRLRRAGDDRARLLATLWAFSAALVAFMSLGKVFSAQYMTWLLPLGAVAGAVWGRGSGWRLVAANALTQADYPFLYGFALRAYPAMAPLLGMAVVARTLALWAWIAAPWRRQAD